MKNVLLAISLLMICNVITAQQKVNSPSGMASPAPDYGTNNTRESSCVNEKGFYDFPFTEEGITVNSSGTGYYVAWGSVETWCDVSTKANSVWIGGDQSSTFTNTFSSPVNDLTYNLTAINYGEVITITTDAETPTITITDGTCPSLFSVSGNVISHGGAGDVIGATILVHSTSDFSSLVFAHNGEGSGTTITLCYDKIILPPIPVSNWAILIGVGLIISFVVIRFRRMI